MMRFAITSGSAPSRPYPTSMRSARSSFARSRSTPSSTVPPRPIFHASATRMPYCSIVSGCVVGTISTATWLPLSRSNAASRASIAARWPGSSVPVWSVTRARSSGTGTSAAAIPAHSSARASTRASTELLRRRSRWRAGAGAEVDRGRPGDRLLVLDREARLRLEAEDLGGEVGRERAHDHVELAHGLDEAVARDGDPVLGALELRLQVAESLVGLELGVVLRDDEQARERGGHLVLRGLELGERLGVVDELGCGRDAADPRPRLGDPRQHVALVRGITLHGVDEIRNEVVAALVLVQHFGPRGLDG